MQHLPFADGPGEALVRSTLERLVERKIMTAELAAEIDPAKIAGLLHSPLGELLKRADWVKREMPFSYGLPAARASSKLGGLEAAGTEADTPAELQLEGETVLIQGIVDCLFLVDGKVILLDYKSDRVLDHRGGVEALAASYRFQLELYAEAVEEITGRPVDEKWLFFFDSGVAVKL